jgi:hypothetical protein
MEESAVLRRENELRKRNEEIRMKKAESVEFESSKNCSTEKIDTGITESEAQRRSTNAVKKFEKESISH